MGELIKKDNAEIRSKNQTTNLMERTEQMLAEARTRIENKNTLSVPIGELTSLGAGVSTLIPALNTITTTTSVSGSGLYTIANMAVGDTLKVARNGNFWGVMKTAEGGSRFAQLQAAGPQAVTTKAVVGCNPYIMMMAVALFAIEKEIGRISDMQKEIKAFLEAEKQSEIEADIEMLMDIISKYKLNWDNEHFIVSNHKMVLDLQRTARKNMNFYKKQVEDKINKEKFFVGQSTVNSVLQEMQKIFQYYRLSIYSFSLSSFMEVMLGGNFDEEYIVGIRDDIRKMSDEYRELFSKSSVKLEDMAKAAIEKNVVKGIGMAGKAVGGLIGNIPFVKDSAVDQFLIDTGESLECSAEDSEKKIVEEFAKVSDPETKVYIEKLDNMIQIYNHTQNIYIDNEKIYLIGEN